MINSQLISALNTSLDTNNLWEGSHKIPWNDPEFSRRMLREHLSQDHDLASRRSETIAVQCQWLLAHKLQSEDRILDLGCGPGLYAEHLGKDCQYCGIDFSPASIQYATQTYAVPQQVSFALGDLCTSSFGSGYDLAMMLFGELNVFSPVAARTILAKAYAALNKGGELVLELHNYNAVKSSGSGQGWYGASTGLFSERPHLCLSQNYWVEEKKTSIQLFHVLENGENTVKTYRSTMQAYTIEEYEKLLLSVGFSKVQQHSDWPGDAEHHVVLSAMKE
ncbi:MAG: class I SAM-dependent methyltransferase [Desulfovibrio sp.]